MTETVKLEAGNFHSLALLYGIILAGPTFYFILLY